MTKHHSRDSAKEAETSDTILVIEDDQALSRLTQRNLQRLGFHTEAALDGAQAIEWVSNNPVKLLLVDYRLPDMTGDKVIKTMTQRGYSFPFIVVTGQGDEETAVEMMKLGARDYLVKDSTFLDRLPLAIERTLEQLSTEQKLAEAEQALRESEEKLRLFLDSATDFFTIWDSELNLIDLNEASLQYPLLRLPYGAKKADFIEKNMLELEPGVKQRGIYDRYLEVIRTGKPFFAEDVIPHPNFGDVRLAVRAFKVGDGLGIVTEDITERKEIERMKSDFVSLVSHQLKTPVAGMLAAIGNMLEGMTGDLTAEQREYLQQMYQMCSRNFRLVSDLLNISRMERGVLSVDIQPIELGEVVELAIQDYSESIEKKGLALNWGKTDEGVVVLADKDKLIEALSNVINNAVKFTDEGAITIETTTEGKYGIIEVRDTGTGMSDDVMKDLFKKEKVLSGAPKPGGGAGLGLYIAKGFMKLQQGDITATSIVGEGSVFVLRIPRK
jgi:signal transduction histidine kinase